MHRRLLPATALLVALIAPAQAGDIRLLSYNLLNYPGSTGDSREAHYRTVLEAAQPDLVATMELADQAAVDEFLADVLNTWQPGAWLAAPWHASPDTDRALFFRAGLCEVLDWGWIATDLRDIEWWRLRLATSGDTLEVYTLHLKASQGSDNEQRRLQEAMALREHLATLPAERTWAVCGDYNLYYSDEPAYQHLLAEGPGQCLDPIDTPGYWHDNPDFAAVHTQSTRTLSFGGGATGGMDDRFDFILVSGALLDDAGLDAVAGSYINFGNDGMHFNTSIIDGENLVVSPEVANALHEASDHLPILVDLRLSGTGVQEAPALAARLGAWPNPFNPATRLGVTLPRAGRARVTVHDTAGRQVALLLDDDLGAGEHALAWRPEGLASGLYLARLALDGRPAAVARLVLLK